MINRIFNILFFPKPNPDVGGKTINKQSSGQGPNYGIYVLIAIAAVALLAGINYAVNLPMAIQAQASPQAPQPPTNPQLEGQPVGTATPPPNGKETTMSYVPKYNPNGANGQEVALNNLPEKLLLANGGIVYMKNLKVEGNYLYGDLVSTVDIPSENVRVAFLDKNGKQIIKAGVSGLLYGGYEAGNVNNMGKKLNRYQEYPIGPIKLKKGEERYFRVLIPNEAKFIQTIR